MVKASAVAVKPDSLAVEFDDERLLAGAGVVLTSTLVDRLGLERLVDETVDLGERPGAARPGRKVLSLAHAIALGADSIDDMGLGRASRHHRQGIHRPPGDIRGKEPSHLGGRARGRASKRH